MKPDRQCRSRSDRSPTGPVMKPDRQCSSPVVFTLHELSRVAANWDEIDRRETKRLAKVANRTQYFEIGEVFFQEHDASVTESLAASDARQE